MEFNFINLIVLLGAIQGFTLCVFLWKRRKINPVSYWFFVLFLFSLAFFNLKYAFHYSGIDHIGSVPLASFPLPYKYLIGVGFYFYCKTQVFKKDYKIHIAQSYLFIPAVVYGFLRGYWYYVILKEGNNRIFREVNRSGFFIYNEFVYLTFNIVLILSVFRFLKTIKNQQPALVKGLRNHHWLRKFSIVFLSVILFDLLLFVLDLVINATDTVPFYYVVLVVNTAFIYWIGYQGFTNPNDFFTKLQLSTVKKNEEKYDLLKEKIEIAMKRDEVFKNQNLKLSSLAVMLDVSVKDLSSYINEVYHMNFSEYLNRQRVQKVKDLLNTPESDKYTLITLAEEAGFSSKSSFNTIFKRITGQTPTAYKKSLNDK